MKDPVSNATVRVSLHGANSFIQSVRTLISGTHLRVVEESNDLFAAPRLIEACQADAAFFSLVDSDTVSVIGEVEKRSPNTAIVAIYGDRSFDLVREAVQLGIEGLIPSDVSVDQLVSTTTIVTKGFCVIPNEAQRALHPKEQRAFPQLSDVQIRMWTLLAGGVGLNEIASQIFLSERQTKRHIAQLLAALGVENRMQAACLAGEVDLLRGRISSPARSEGAGRAPTRSARSVREVAAPSSW